MAEQVIFWAKARGLQIAHFVPEKKQGGIIDQSEGSLRFSNHVYVTEDPKEIKFIRASKSYKNGFVVEVPDMATATMKTAARETARNARLSDSGEATRTDFTDFDKKLTFTDDQFTAEVVREETPKEIR